MIVETVQSLIEKFTLFLCQQKRIGAFLRCVSEDLFQFELIPDIGEPKILSVGTSSGKLCVGFITDSWSQTLKKKDIPKRCQIGLKDSLILQLLLLFSLSRLTSPCKHLFHIGNSFAADMQILRRSLGESGSCNVPWAKLLFRTYRVGSKRPVSQESPLWGVWPPMNNQDVFVRFC